MSDPNETIAPLNRGDVSHTTRMVRSIKDIPPERLNKKVGRTLFGLAVLAAALKGGPWLKDADIAHAKEIQTIALVAGAVMCSFEFIVLPLNVLLALGKDAVNLFVAFVTRQRANGDTP